MRTLVARSLAAGAFAVTLWGAASVQARHSGDISAGTSAGTPAGISAGTSNGTSAGSPAGVRFFESKDVAAAFAQGRPILEEHNYKIHASRREAPGMAEVHRKDTDIIYVLDGGATLVVGGAVVDGKTTAKDEIRGSSIDGGTPYTLVKGDVLVVPHGIPHWFKDVTPPLLYYVVKVQ